MRERRFRSPNAALAAGRFRVVTRCAKRSRDFRYTLRTTATALRFAACTLFPARTYAMAKPNYQFDKRQRDLAKKKKQDAKRLKKLAKNEKRPDGTDATDAPSASADDTSPAS